MKTAAGPSITVTAWGYKTVAAAVSNYLSLLQALRTLQSDPSAAQEAQALADAVARDAGVDPATLDAADMPVLLEVIHELNSVEDALGKPVALLVRCLLALQRAQQSEPEEPAATETSASVPTPS